MRRLTGTLLAVLTVLALLAPASASRHLEAKNVVWRGGPFLLNQDTGELVRLDTDTVLLNGVADLQGDGESLWARTAENWFQVESDGTLTPSGIQPLPDAWYEECVWGLLLSESSDRLRVYRLTDGIPLANLPGYGTSDVRVYRDAETEEVFLLARNGLFLRSDGTPVAEGYAAFEFNAEWELATNGKVCGYRNFWEDPADAEAVVLDLKTGAEIASFQGVWRTYDAQGEIYRDDTAVLEGSRIVRLTGETLLDLTGRDTLSDRTENEPYYRFEADEQTCFFYPETGEIRSESAPSEGPKLEWFNESDSDTGQSGYRILGADGQALTPEPWREVLWYAYDLDGIGRLQPFYPMGIVPVVSMDGKLGILRQDGAMALPAVFDYDGYASYAVLDGEGCLVRKDGVWQIYDPAGNQIF